MLSPKNHIHGKCMRGTTVARDDYQEDRRLRRFFRIGG
jgi:hypothetical protein